MSPSRGLVLSYVHYFPLLPRRVGNSCMIYIIMNLNLPIISIYILLLYYNIPTHPYTSPYTPKHHHTPLYNTIHPIHHLMYSTIIIGMFRYIIIIIYEVPTPRSCLGLRQHTSSFNLPGQNSCKMLLNLKTFSSPLNDGFCVRKVPTKRTSYSFQLSVLYEVFVHYQESVAESRNVVGPSLS